MTHHKDSIIDTHLHLALDALNFPAKRAVLLAELKQNGVDRSIVIADSTPESTIGSVRAAQHFSEAFRPRHRERSNNNRIYCFICGNVV